MDPREIEVRQKLVAAYPPPALKRMSPGIHVAYGLVGLVTLPWLFGLPWALWVIHGFIHWVAVYEPSRRYAVGYNKWFAEELQRQLQSFNL